MLRKRSSKADAVLAIINDLADEDVVIDVQAYVNGREHGWKVTTAKANVAVSFSENRNSDQIVIYVDAEKYSDRLSEEAYKSRKYFNYNEYYQAASFIMSTLSLSD